MKRLPRAHIYGARAFIRRESTASIPAAMKARPAKLVPDHLSPTNSSLLSTCLSDLFGGADPAQPSGTSLPQGHHLVYFPIQSPASKLAPDGADADHAPPGDEYPRRVWAGGEVHFRSGWENDLLLDGRAAQCREKIEDVSLRGDKVFVDLSRKYGLPDGEVAIEETRTLVFMKNVDQSTKRLIKSVSYEPTHRYNVTPLPLHLFQFSALTYNAHAIHYDRLYARETDRHRDMLVHGPLTLALMLRAVGQQRVKSIVYRNHAPLYVGDAMSVCVRRPEEGQRASMPWDVWVEGPEGGLAVKGTVVMA